MGKCLGVIVCLLVMSVAPCAAVCTMHEWEEKTRQAIAATDEMRQRDPAKAAAAEHELVEALRALDPSRGEQQWVDLCKLLDKLLADLQQ